MLVGSYHVAAYHVELRSDKRYSCQPRPAEGHRPTELIAQILPLIIDVFRCRYTQEKTQRERTVEAIRPLGQ